MTEALPADLASLCGLFAARLHAAGLPVTAEHGARLARVIELAQPVRQEELYWCARVTHVSSLHHLDAFDAVFGAVFGGSADVADWRGEPAATPRREPAVQESAFTPPGGTVGGGDLTSGSGPTRVGRRPGSTGERERVLALRSLASVEERLATTHFAHLSSDELAALAPFLRSLAFCLPERLTRRRRRDRSGDRLDVRAMLRRCRRSGGDPASVLRRRRRRRPRRLVALLDISGSMEPYARAYLQTLWCATTTVKAETFVFGTRLTRVTGALAIANPNLALSRAGALAPDWSGGTRIGEAMKVFLDRYGRRGMARGAVVLVVSDGWERGDAELLGAQMKSLGRLAHRVVWVNPRAAAVGFEPRAAGMAAALPHLDALVSGHSAASLDEVLAALGGGLPRSPMRPR